MPIVVVKDAEEKAIALTRLLLTKAKAEWQEQQTYRFSVGANEACDFIESAYDGVLDCVELYLLSDDAGSVKEKEDLLREYVQNRRCFEGNVRSWFYRDFTKAKQKLEEKHMGSVPDQDVVVPLHSESMSRYVRQTVANLMDLFVDRIEKTHIQRGALKPETRPLQDSDPLALFSSAPPEAAFSGEILDRLRSNSKKPLLGGKTKPTW